jgi:hypothetical protein
MKSKVAGAILVVGIILGGYGIYQQTQDNQIIEIGNMTIDRSAEHNINWMEIAGGALVVVGLVAFFVPGKK